MPFDFGTVYGMADSTAGLIETEDWYPAIVGEASYDRTKAGDKWAWTVKFLISAGEYTNKQLTMTLSINPLTRKGEKNSYGLGVVFRQLHTLGVPTGPPFGPQGEQPFWAAFPVSPANPDLAIRAAGAAAAQAMTGRPCRIYVIKNEWEGGTNNRVDGIKPAQPGDPTALPQGAQQAPPQGYAPPMQPTQYQQPQPFTPPQPYPPQGYPQQLAQPVQGQQGYAPPQPGPQGSQWQGQQAPPQQWQNVAGQPAEGPPQAGAGAPPVAPQAPPAPAGDPGQPGMGQFAPQGQAPAQPPAAPPWAQQQQNGAPQVPPQPQQAQPGTPGQAPAQPPWAQQG